MNQHIIISKNSIAYKPRKLWFNKHLGAIQPKIRKYFNVEYNKIYNVSISEGTDFSLSIYQPFNVMFYILTSPEGSELGLICKDIFDKMFFTPDTNKTYNITVEEIKD